MLKNNVKMSKKTSINVLTHISGVSQHLQCEKTLANMIRLLLDGTSFFDVVLGGGWK